jgi:uncharacterized membrane protein/protein-disulfide isomerase
MFGRAGFAKSCLGFSKAMNDSACAYLQTTSRKKIKALPFPFYFWFIVGLAALGLLDSLYLSISHYRVYTDIDYKSFCALSRAINCDTISQSPYSIFLGMPVPVWGIIGYAFFLVLMAQSRIERNTAQLWTLLFLIALAFSVYSVILALISTYLIRSYCIMCIVSYAINLGLLFYTWLVLRRFSERHFWGSLRADLHHLVERKRQYGLIFGVSFMITSAIWLWIPDYWNMTAPLPSTTFSTGITPDGHPWIGAEKPEIEIVEFTDYRCFQCRKMNDYLRGLMAQYPNKIRIIHRHFPMDHRVNPLVKRPMHIGAGAMAMMAIYAAEQGRFWQTHDFLFAMRDQAEIGTRTIAQEVGLSSSGLVRALQDPHIFRKLNEDLAEGIRLGVTGTPSYVIEGNVYSGQLPPEILMQIQQ